MTTTRTISEQLSSLPIPPAALVIDMRGVDDQDDVLETLRIEIENLATEMNMQKVNHWRYLTSFLEYKELQPLTLDEVKALRAAEDHQHAQQQRALGGRHHLGQLRNEINNMYEFDEAPRSFIEEIPNDEFRRDIEECIQIIDTVRNKRIEATGDVGKVGKVGRNTINPKVQVIFLADAETPDTLSSAAAYAAHLKYEYSKLEQSGQLVLDTMVICLNYNNQATSPIQLMNRLRWRYADDTESTADDWNHIDSLILCERYGANAARIPKGMQPFVAELLLYALLITQPLVVRPSAPDTSTRFLPPPHTKEIRSLPPKTYLVGLAAIEHSTRWGRRFVNYSVVTDVVQVLQDKRFDEQIKTTRTVEIWLSDWRTLVESAIPEQVVGDVPKLRAFAHSAEVAASSGRVFTPSSIMIDTGAKTIPAVQRYVNAVAETYTISVEEREVILREARIATGKQNVSLQPTLEDALGAIPMIQQQVDTWQSGDPETSLVQAQLKAQRLLSEPEFFTGAQGAIPRAKLQLSELSKAIRGFQNKHKQASVNLDERRESLRELRDEKINDLQAHINKLPFLAGFLPLKGFLAWLTLLFVIILTAIAFIIGFAWIHHVLLLLVPDFVDLIDGTLFGISFYTMILFAACLVATLFILRSARHLFLDLYRSALRIELYFWLALIAFPILGLIVTLSAGLNAIDPSSGVFLIWLSRLPFWSTIIVLIALTILIGEVIYYFFWHNGLVGERAQIVEAVRHHQKETAQAVVAYIAGALALELLKRAELTDGNGGPGQYYRRMERISTQLDNIGREAAKEYQLAKRRLTARSNEPPRPTTTKMPTLHIREEILDVPKLAVSSKQLRDSITAEREEFKELAELLVRVIGEEAPIQIEQQFRERPFVEQRFDEQPFQSSREEHDANLLMSTAAAFALRMSVDKPKADIVTPLIERYEELDYRVTDHLPELKSLLETMQELITYDTSDAKNADTTDNHPVDRLDLATRALTLWGQMLWEYKDGEINKLLSSEGVMSQLQQGGYDPQTVKSLLATRTVISGRSMNVGQIGELYLLMFPSTQGYRFFQDMRLDPRFVSIPDTERLLLLYIHQYVAQPQFITDPDIDNSTANGKNGRPSEGDGIIDVESEEAV